ncbi:MAG: DUF2608 domain-containing protein [Alphaproteobacteria bacterium]|nr:DUF2608 domain-containing protein [Alphaproteobacteria bacterium]
MKEVNGTFTVEFRSCEMRFNVRCVVSWMALALLFGCVGNDDYIKTGEVRYEKAANLSRIDDILSHSIQKPEDILVVFDFNYTLMYPLTPCLHKINVDAHKNEFKRIISQLSYEQADKMLTQMMVTQNQKLINERLSAFLKKYSKVNFIVCSSSLEKNVDAYLNLLNKNGIEINNSYNLQGVEFLEFPKYLSGYPVYKRGIITTNRCSKGDVLVSFFRRIAQKPKLIIFVDNSTSKLEDVQAAIKSLKNVKLIIVEYLEYKDKPIPKVSKKEFSRYWYQQVKNFLHTQT